jgi:nucleotide-binding universal stress UspA family protein
MSRSTAPFRSVLVPVDGSRLAEQALPIALAIAERAQSKLRVVLVHQLLQPLVVMEPGYLYTRTELTLQKADRDYLRGLVGRLRKRMGRSVSSAMLKGPAAATLAEYVRDVGVDLVVMTTHGRGGIQRAWLGSVADQLIRSLEIPVLLMRAGQSDSAASSVNLSEILLPLDGSPLAEAAIEPAMALARLWDAEISLVQVVQPVALTTDPPLAFPTEIDDQLTAIRREAAQDYLRDVAERLREQGVRASGVAFLGGGVAETLLHLARPERVGLLAMATHGRGGVRRLVLGSVADKLVRAAEVPVLVCRPSGKRSKRTSRGGGRDLEATVRSASPGAA